MLLALLAASAFARPLDFRELSLLVRTRESDPSILATASQRKLVRPLTAQQESTLRAQGASDSLIRSLHNSNLVLTPSEAAAYEAAGSTPPATGQAHETLPASPRQQSIQLVDVGVDKPVNLNFWGGPDLEFSFRGPDIVETGRSEVELIQPTLSAVHYATYQGIRVPGWEPIDPQYTSITAHSFARPLYIDWRNPVRVNEVPYLLYPVYSTGGASLYFVGRMSDDVVRVAVISR